MQQFNAFDVGRNGYLTFAELVRMFGGVEDVTYEHAEAIAHSVLHVAGKELEDKNVRAAQTAACNRPRLPAPAASASPLPPQLIRARALLALYLRRRVRAVASPRRRGS